MCRKEGQGQERQEGKKTNKEKSSSLECPSASPYVYATAKECRRFPTRSAVISNRNCGRRDE